MILQLIYFLILSKNEIMNTKIYIYFFILFLTFSCNKKVTILATKDATLFNNYPEINFNGKKIVSEKLGYQTVKNNKYGKITYPALYIGSGNPDSIKDAFVIGGFDVTNIKPNFKKSLLKFFINYSSFTRKNITIVIRPIKKEWDEEKVNYFSFYKSIESGSELTNTVESNEKKCKIIVFDVKESKEKDYYEIPFNKNGKEICINITDMVRNCIKDQSLKNGFLIDPLWMSDLRYRTTTETREISFTGIIEIGSSEWLYWESSNSNFKNKAKGKIKYVPRIEIFY